MHVAVRKAEVYILTSWMLCSRMAEEFTTI